MQSVCKVLLLGNLTHDAKMASVGADTTVANFSVATSETWKGKDGQVEEKVEFTPVAYFGAGAKAIGRYLTKGTPVFVEGRLRTRAFEKDGIERKVTEVRAERVVLLGGRRDDSPAATQPSDDFGAGDIPF